MARQHRRFGALTDNEAEVLYYLVKNRDRLNSPALQGHGAPGWCRSRDVGGYHESHHSHTLHRLTQRGLVEQRPYGGGCPARQSWMYRVNPEGVGMWQSFEEKAGADLFHYLPVLRGAAILKKAELVF